MNALIFAAGLGTRLAHITKSTPKALVEVAGKPMLLHAIEKLKNAGIKRIVINIHHHPEKMKSYINSLNINHVDIVISDESKNLLETGGGLLNAQSLFLKDEPIIMYNSDVLTGVDLNEMIKYHHQKGGIATLMVKDRPTSRYFLFDDEMRLSGWKNISTKELINTRSSEQISPYAFSGIHIVNYDILNYLGKIRKFSITKGYLDISASFPIFGWKDWKEHWFDIGTPEKLDLVNNFYSKTK